MLLLYNLSLKIHHNCAKSFWKLLLHYIESYIELAQTTYLTNDQVQQEMDHNKQHHIYNKFSMFFCNNVKGQPMNLKVQKRGNDISSKLSFHVSNERRFGYKIESYIE
jgi:hypothetical protein